MNICNYFNKIILAICNFLNKIVSAIYNLSHNNNVKTTNIGQINNSYLLYKDYVKKMDYILLIMKNAIENAVGPIIYYEGSHWFIFKSLNGNSICVSLMNTEYDNQSLENLFTSKLNNIYFDVSYNEKSFKIHKKDLIKSLIDLKNDNFNFAEYYD
jgi:hypothetical protein